MQAVVLVIHIFLALGLIATILLQRSEGGALGMGGGPGGLMSGRAAGDALSRSTSILGAGFIMTSIALAALSGIGGERDTSIVEGLEVDPLAPVAPLELELPTEPTVPRDE